MKPLFIPLKKAHFLAFERGEKTEEFRRLGPRWNRTTCQVGRPVVLSLGYGRRRRLEGVITGYRVTTLTHELPGFVECYGPDVGPGACIIGIKLSSRP